MFWFRFSGWLYLAKWSFSLHLQCLSLFSILLLRRVCCEGQCETGELCRWEVDSWTSLSYLTGETDDYSWWFLWGWWGRSGGARHDQNNNKQCGGVVNVFIFCILRTSTATVTGWSWEKPFLTALWSDQTNLLRTWQVGCNSLRLRFSEKSH